MLIHGQCQRCGRRDIVNEHGNCLECMSPKELAEADEEATQRVLVAAILVCCIVFVIKMVVL